MSYNNREYVPTHISAASSSQIFTGRGTIHNIVVNSTTATIFGIYDGVGSSTIVIGKLKASVTENTYQYDAVIANGLYIECGAGDYTILWIKA